MYTTLRTGQVGDLRTDGSAAVDIEHRQFKSLDLAHEYFHGQTESLRSRFEYYTFEIWGPEESFKPVFSIWGPEDTNEALLASP